MLTLPPRSNPNPTIVTISVPSTMPGHAPTSVDLEKFNVLKAGYELDLDTGFFPPLEPGEKLSLKSKLENPNPNSEEVRRVLNDQRFRGMFLERIPVNHVTEGLGRTAMPMILFTALFTSILWNDVPLGRVDEVALLSTFLLSGVNSIWNGFVVLVEEFNGRIPKNNRIEKYNAKTATLLDFLMKR
jgi:hypothetical protein